jgi:hypothetical protein
MHLAKFSSEKAPFLYFSAVWLWIAFPGLITGNAQSIGPLIISTGFVISLFYQRKGLNLLIGILMFFWSILILFAYLSDASKPDSTDLEAWRFLIFGGLLSALNFLMSFLIVKKSINKSSLTTDRINAPAI